MGKETFQTKSIYVTFHHTRWELIWLTQGSQAPIIVYRTQQINGPGAKKRVTGINRSHLLQRPYDTDASDHWHMVVVLMLSKDSQVICKQYNTTGSFSTATVHVSHTLLIFIDSNGIMPYFCVLDPWWKHYIMHFQRPPPLCLNCMKWGRNMIQQCSQRLLIALMLCVCSQLWRDQRRRHERTLFMMAEAAGEFLITGSRGAAWDEDRNKRIKQWRNHLRRWGFWLPD